MKIVPPKLLAKTLPRRAIAGSAVAPTPSSAKRALVHAAKTYAKRPWFAAAFAKGVGEKTDAKLKPVRAAAHALLSSPTLEAIAAADVPILAAAECMLRWCASQLREDDSLVAPIVVARGLGDVIDVLVARLGLEVDGEGMCRYVRVDREPTGGELPALRHAVCAADDKTYAAAVTRATAHRKKLGLNTRAALAWAFPDEPWATEDLLAGLEDREAFRNPMHAVYLLGACSDVRAVDAVLEKFDGQFISDHALELVQVLPENDALRILSAALAWSFAYRKSDKTPKQALVQAIACIRSEAAAAFLAPYLGHAVLGPIVAAYFQDAPELQAAIAGAEKKGKGKTAATAARVRGTTQKSSATSTVTLASEADVPAVLRDKPWRPRKNQGEPIVLSLRLGERDAHDERLERARTTLAEIEASSKNPSRDMTEKELATWRRNLDGKHEMPSFVPHQFMSKGDPYAYPRKGEFARVPFDEGLREYDAGRAHWLGRPDTLFAFYGVDALPGFLVRFFGREGMRMLGTESGDRNVAALACVVSPRAVPAFAWLFSRRKEYRREARAWLLRNAETAARGLVVDALGAIGDARADAEKALRLLGDQGKRDVVLRVARAHGAEAEAGIVAFLDRDPLAIDVNAPKLPEFLRVDALPSVTTKAGARLGPDARDALLELLRVAHVEPFDPPYPGISAVRAACDAASLGAFAIELLEQWVLAGAPGRYDWMLFAVVSLHPAEGEAPGTSPSAEGVRRIVALTREWARKDAAKATRGCTALAAIGSDASLMHLAHVAETTRYAALRKDARALLEDAAAAHGLTRDELDDRAVPDLDLGAAGTLTLTYGRRSFVVGLDEALRPIARASEDTGKPALRALPRATKDDDAALVKASRARFDALVTDATAIRDRQVRRFERAMAEQRAWSRPDFLSRVVRSPILQRLARSLVWEALAAKGARFTFRVAEDGSLAGAKDERVTLPESSSVRIAHPVTLGANLAAWRRIFDEYEILQPFEQLGREVHAITDAERSATSFERFARVVVAAARVLGTLESRAWRRDDTSQVGAYLRVARGEGDARFEVQLPISPGIPLENVTGAPEQTLGELRVRREGSRESVRLGALDPVEFSEIVRDLESLRAPT